MQRAIVFCIFIVMLASVTGCIAGTGPATPSSPREITPDGSYHFGGGSIAISVNGDELSTHSAEAKELFIKGLTLSTQYAQYNESLEYFNRALALDPRFTEVWVSQGVAFYNLKRFDEANECYDRALAIDPSNEMVRTLKAMSLKDKGRLAKLVDCNPVADRACAGYLDNPGAAIDPACTHSCIGYGYVVPAGGDVYLGESCLDVSAAVSSGQVISWYSDGRRPGNGTPDATRIVNDAGIFFVNPDDFLGHEGPWYIGTTDSVAFVVKMPVLDMMSGNRTSPAGVHDIPGCRGDPEITLNQESQNYLNVPPVTELQKADALRIASGSVSNAAGYSTSGQINNKKFGDYLRDSHGTVGSGWSYPYSGNIRLSMTVGSQSSIEYGLAYAVVDPHSETVISEGFTDWHKYW